MSLDNDLDIFLTLADHRRSLQLFVLLFKQEVELALLSLNHGRDLLISLLLELEPFVWRLLRE